MSDEIEKIANLLHEVSKLFPEYIFNQERLRDELNKSNEDLKQSIIEKDRIIEVLNKQLEEQNIQLKEPKKSWYRNLL